MISITGDFGVNGNLELTGDLTVLGNVSISGGQLTLPFLTRADQIPTSPQSPGTIWNNGGILTVSV